MGSFITRFIISLVIFFLLGMLVFGFLMTSELGAVNKSQIETRIIPIFAFIGLLVIGFFYKEIYPIFADLKSKAKVVFTDVLISVAFLWGGSISIWYLSGSHWMDYNSMKVLNFHRLFTLEQTFYITFLLFIGGIFLRRLVNHVQEHRSLF